VGARNKQFLVDKYTKYARSKCICKYQGWPDDRSLGHPFFGHNDGHYDGHYRKSGHNVVLMTNVYLYYKSIKH
jgi:hypothetical protein